MQAEVEEKMSNIKSRHGGGRRLSPTSAVFVVEIGLQVDLSRTGTVELDTIRQRIFSLFSDISFEVYFRLLVARPVDTVCMAAHLITSQGFR